MKAAYMSEENAKPYVTHVHTHTHTQCLMNDLNQSVLKQDD